MLYALKMSIQRGESEILVQLLSLLRTILLKSNLHTTKTYLDDFLNILQSKLFMNTLLSGLKNEFHYIITEFTNFINSCLTMLSQIMTHPGLTSIVKNVITSYYELIVKETEKQNVNIYGGKVSIKNQMENEVANTETNVPTESSLMVL